MKRTVIDQLHGWKNSNNRKPLILLGARQVGKTWVLKEFGRTAYKSVAYLNCDNNPNAQELFSDYNLERILRSISALTGVSILPEETLIILDEIQEVPNGLGVLKYFCENKREYHIAAAGSLLGITLHPGTSFPVGKVDFIQMYPMSFEEFMIALGKETALDLLRNRQWDSIHDLRNYYEDCLRQYYFVGGMPEAVASYIEFKDVWRVRQVQKSILNAYQNDISKHVSTEQVKRINMVWNAIPSQLTRENKKFVYRVLKKGARANDFEHAIQWLCDAGLVYKVSRVSKPVMPLKFYEDPSAFKLFLLDCGLLAALAEAPPGQMLMGNNAFVEFKGAFTENYVLQQLKTVENMGIYYFTNERSTLEIDFVVQHNERIIPIEVKAEVNLRAKSLRQFVNDHPELKALRFSMNGYEQQDWMENVPLYTVAEYFRCESIWRNGQ